MNLRCELSLVISYRDVAREDNIDSLGRSTILNMTL